MKKRKRLGWIGIYHDYHESSLAFGFLILYLVFIQTSSKITSKLAHPNAPLGYGLCFLNLAFDGFTNATQDSLKAR